MKKKTHFTCHCCWILNIWFDFFVIDVLDFLDEVFLKRVVRRSNIFHMSKFELR